MDEDEVQVEEKVQEVVEKPKPVVEILELNNPSYLMRSRTFQDMLRKFYESINPPTVTYESMLNFMLQMVNNIYTATQNGVKQDVNKIRFILGFEDKVLKGFVLYYMLPNGIPHIMTLEVPYMYSESIRVSYALNEEIRKSKKRWNCTHIACTIANDKLLKIIKRGMRNPRIMAYVVAEDIRNALIKT